MKANFGLMPPLERKIRQKQARYQAYAERALRDLTTIVEQLPELQLKAAL
jgi:methylenetetrahydrofolate--tRNA-(uracil-5-)-methyltransferase